MHIYWEGDFVLPLFRPFPLFHSKPQEPPVVFRSANAATPIYHQQQSTVQFFLLLPPAFCPLPQELPLHNYLRSFQESSPPKQDLQDLFHIFQVQTQQSCQPSMPALCPSCSTHRNLFHRSSLKADWM